MSEKESVIKTLKEFKSKASNELHINKMFLFGSRASGKPNRWSDIDLIIVSDNFANMRFRKRATKMYDYWNFDYPIDFLCYTQKEFKKLSKQVTIVSEAIKNGIEV